MTTITSCLLNWHHQLVLSTIIISQSHISKISTRCWKDIDRDQQTLIHFSHLFLFLLSKISISTLEKYEKLISLSTLETRDRNFKFLILLSKSEIRISHFSFYSQNSRSESRISLSTLEILDQNFKFLFLLSKFEIRISYFSFYSRNSRPEFQISLSTLEIRDQNFKFLFLLSNLLFLTLVNA